MGPAQTNLLAAIAYSASIVYLVGEPMTTLSRIRQSVINRNYYLSSHAEEEMTNDRLERKDVENAILRGRVNKKLTRDLRGTRYRIAGPSEDGRPVHVACRFTEGSGLIIITVYAVEGTQ